MEALTSLGINGKLLIAQIINFLILLFLLSKLLYKPLLKVMDERTNKIESGLKAAEKSEADLKKAEEEAEKIREKAYKESNGILANAKAESDKMHKELIAKAEAQADQIRHHAAEEALAVKDKALKEAKVEITSLIVLALEKITQNKFSLENKEELAKNAAKEIL